MGEADPSSGGGGEGPDPVAAARRWLERYGVTLEPNGPGDDRQAERGRLARAGGTGLSEDSGLGDEAGSAGQASGWGELVAPDGDAGQRTRGFGERHAPSDRDAAVSEDPDADPETLARTIVLRKLAASARTRHELAKALASRNVPAAVAEQVLDRMQAVGLVDDVGFARDWVESRQQRRHLSRSALRRELSAKGVERATVEAAVADVDAEAELTAARALAERKLRPMTDLPREVQYRRLSGALARRGFSAGVTAAVLGDLLSHQPDD